MGRTTTDGIDTTLEAQALLANAKAVRAQIEDVLARATSPELKELGSAALAQLAGIELSMAVAGAKPDLASLAQIVRNVATLATALDSKAAVLAARGDGDERSSAIATTRAAVQAIADEIYEKKVLDPYLKFDSAQDEEAYRRRAEQNRAAIADELSKGTLQGNLAAAQIQKRQLNDAKAHGADASPDFAALVRANSDVIEKVKGITKGADGRNVASTDAPVPSDDKSPVNLTAPEMATLLSALKAAGVTTAEAPSDSVRHGLTADARSQSATATRT